MAERKPRMYQRPNREATPGRNGAVAEACIVGGLGYFVAAAVYLPNMHAGQSGGGRARIAADRAHKGKLILIDLHVSIPELRSRSGRSCWILAAKSGREHAT